MNWNVAAVVGLLGVGFVLHAHWQAHRRAWPAWTLALGGARRALVQWLRVQTGAHLGTLDGTLRVAREDHTLGRSTDAIQVIGQADVVAARHVRLLRTWLQRWADVARTRATLSPAPATSMAWARLPPLRRLAALQRIGDALLPRRAMRFQAGIRLQRVALKWVGWSSAAAALRARRAGRVGQALDDLDATRADLVALDGQALTTLEHLLHSLPHDESGYDSASDGEGRQPSDPRGRSRAVGRTRHSSSMRS